MNATSSCRLTRQTSKRAGVVLRRTTVEAGRGALIVTRKWRRGRDSNPRYPSGYSGFQDHRHRPLGHLSSAPFYSHRRASPDVYLNFSRLVIILDAIANRRDTFE